MLMVSKDSSIEELPMISHFEDVTWPCSGAPHSTPQARGGPGKTWEEGREVEINRAWGNDQTGSCGQDQDHMPATL